MVTPTDAVALNDAFGFVASHTGYFVVMLAFGLAVATVAAFKAGRYA